MGMYTGLRLSAKLKDETKSEWLPVLEFMLDPSESGQKPEEAKDHKLFSTDRWSWMLQGATSTYLEPEFISDSKIDKNTNELFVQFNIKNYKNEIEEFLDWLSPHIETFNFGYWRYEEYLNESEIILQDGKLTIIYDTRMEDY